MPAGPPSLLVTLSLALVTGASMTTSHARAATCASWVVVASPNPGPVNNQLLGVAAIGASDVWAVGLSAETADSPYTITEHWNGTTWRTVPGAGSGSGALFAVDGIASNDVWTVGQPALIENWNGTSWAVATPAVPRGGAGLAFRGVSALASNDVWAVGWYSKGTVKSLVEHWNGSKWSVVPSPNAGAQVPSRLFGVSARSSTDVWAVGFSGASGSEQSLIEHWNGATWSMVPSPLIGTSPAYLLAVSTLSASHAFAVGRGNGPLIERWNGTSWSLSASPSAHDSLSGIVSLTTTNAWATGIDWSSGPLVEHWDGASWSLVATPAVAPGANGLADVDAVSASDLWAVGDQGVAGGKLGTLTEHYVERSC